MNAPELGGKGRSAEPFAQASRRRLQALIDTSGGRIAILPGQQARDHYGRVLAHAFDSKGGNLEAALLAEGLGYFVAIAPNTALADCHRRVELQAREAGQGLWRRSPAIAAEDLRRAGFALVRARVERLEKNRSGLWLELEGPLVLQIPQQDAADFDQKLLAGLRGRTIEVRGWVIDRKGRADLSRQARWLMKVTHSSMLNPLSE